MNNEDSQVSQILQSAALDASPDPVHMHAVRDRMLTLGHAQPARRQRRRTLVMGSGLLVACAAAGIAATQTGRNFVMEFFTPVLPSHGITGQSPDGNTWIVTRTGDDVTPFTPAEEQAERAEMDEVYAIRQAGGGQLVRIFEGFAEVPDPAPTQTSFCVAYKLSSGVTKMVGEGQLTEKQASNIHLDEILKLRDAGAGELISQRPGSIGLGEYKIRFTLSDGSTADVKTNYPPAPRAERDAIFAETRKLKEQRQFAVRNASSPAQPNALMFGILRYKLADGRMVGIVESVPPDMITPDGKNVVSYAQESEEPPRPEQNGGFLDGLKKVLDALPEAD